MGYAQLVIGPAGSGKVNNKQKEKCLLNTDVIIIM